MPTYTQVLSGGKRQCGPGESLTLFDGTETPAEGLASMCFARGYSAGQAQAYSTFHADGMPSDMVIDVQAANVDAEADYHTIGQMTSENASPAGFPFFTDDGSPAFYRLKISAYTSGSMPIVTVQR